MSHPVEPAEQLAMLALLTRFITTAAAINAVNSTILGAQDGPIFELGECLRATDDLASRYKGSHEYVEDFVRTLLDNPRVYIQSSHLSLSSQVSLMLSAPVVLRDLPEFQSNALSHKLERYLKRVGQDPLVSRRTTEIAQYLAVFLLASKQPATLKAMCTTFDNLVSQIPDLNEERVVEWREHLALLHDMAKLRDLI